MTTSHDMAQVLPRNTLAFVASPRAPLVEEEKDDVAVLEDSFVAARENGFVLRRGDDMTYLVPRRASLGEPNS